MNIDLLNKIQAQINKCYEKYGAYSSFHESMSVLREEFEELWAECKKKELDFELIENEIIDNITVLLKMHKDIVGNKNRR